MPLKPSLTCSTCRVTNMTLAEVTRHIELNHGSKTAKVCLYCNVVFPSNSEYKTHMENDHGLPVWNLEDVPRVHGDIGASMTQSAFNGAANVYSFKPTADQIDILEYLVGKKAEIDILISSHVADAPQKLQITTDVSLSKPSSEENSQQRERITIYVHTKMSGPIYHDGISEEQYLDLINDIICSISSFSSHGSGWTIESLDKVDVKIMRYSPIRGSSYLSLDPALCNNQNLINIRNFADNNCFLYCFTAGYHLKFGPDLMKDNRLFRPRTNPLTYHPSNAATHQAVGDFEMPMSLNRIDRFEDLNQVQVNVFRYEKKALLPLRISKHKDFNFVLDLLLLSNGNTHHYVLITDLYKLICSVRGKSYRSRSVLCRNCFYVCSSLNSYRDHQRTCLQNAPAEITMPTEENKFVKFKHLQARAHLPFVVYFDLESLIVPVDTVKNDPNRSSTTTLEHHVPCSFCIVVVEHGNPSPVMVEMERGPNVMDKFIQVMEKLARDFYNKKRQHVNFIGTPPVASDDATICWLCENCFESGDAKVLDHCHYTGKFLGWAHNQCNLMRKTTVFTPVFAHNLQNYDMHHVFKALQSCNRGNQFSIVPSTEEKFISLEMRVFIKSYRDKNGVEKNVYEKLRFLDSFKFMGSSLAQLANNLPPNRFQLLDNYFSGMTNDQRELIKQKGYYPYSWVSSFSKFSSPALPPKSEWKNSLDSFAVTLTDDEYNHALNVFQSLNCHNFGEYHDIYLKCDTLILACVFEEFRSVCYGTYGLDCAQFFTASNLSGAAYLKVCKPELELLTCREMLDMTENLTRGGVSSVYSKRLAIANNKFLPNYNPDKPSTFIIFIDANNLYGGIMEKRCLPLKNFEWVNVNVEEVLSTPDDAQCGYILEVDLEYPDYLHEEHSDFPLAPTKDTVNRCWLSDYQLDLMRGLPSTCQNKKLLQTLHKKSRYTLHYVTLKLYVKLGLRVTHVHRIMRFTQSKWMAPYIQLNTNRRKLAANKFQQDFFKLMSNSAFGKLCEGKRNRVSVRVVRDENALLDETQKSNVKTVNIIDQSLATVNSKQIKIAWDKPTLVGAVVLDLAKEFMFNFHYNVMKKNFDCTLLYSDTDSFVYEIRTDDFYGDLRKNEQVKTLFDFSNMPTSNPLHNKSNERETLLFKDEMAGRLIREHCALKSKLYSVLAEGNYTFGYL